MAQIKITLACSICGSRNYQVSVNQQHTTRLTLNKYCKHCNKQTLHQETR
ncbi:50S ribosomal protein L33 [Loigolactobacillus backii]|nr:50S ribosomal protein L33 [Loigolactobacillus backii]PIO82983.1 50S ribosomal protein L33 [Loigolactobacillus backii]